LVIQRAVWDFVIVLESGHAERDRMMVADRESAVSVTELSK
jgi:hypothetical protein